MLTAFLKIYLAAVLGFGTPTVNAGHWFFVKSGVSYVTDAKSYEFIPASSTSLNCGDIDAIDITAGNAWSACFYYKTDVVTSTLTTIMGKMVGSGTFRGWVIYEQSALLRFFVVDNVTGSLYHEVSVTGYYAATNTWYHTCITRGTANSATDISMYRDGSGVTETVVTNGTVTTSTNSVAMIMGARFETPQDFADGHLTWVSFYNDELTSGEVSELADLTSGPVDPRSVASSANLVYFAPLGELTDTLDSANGTTDLVGSTTCNDTNMTNATHLSGDIPS